MRHYHPDLPPRPETSLRLVQQSGMTYCEKGNYSRVRLGKRAIQLFVDDAEDLHSAVTVEVGTL